MNKIIGKLKRYTRISFQALIFVATAMALFFILPGTPKFKYEYQKGFPWKHENLVATFDFAIQKTSVEIDEEKAEIEQSVIPYFKADQSKLKESLSLLRLDAGVGKDTSDTKKKFVIERLVEVVKEIYGNGVLQFSPDSYSELKDKNKIKKRTGSNIRTIEIDKLYSEKTAYNRLLDICRELEKQDGNGWLRELNLERYVKSNLAYDSKTTQKEIDAAENKISLTRGMVKAGERIILAGEIVDAEKYQVLESLKASYEKERGGEINSVMVAVGKILLICIVLSLMFTFLFLYRRDILQHLRRLSFIMLLMLGIVALANFANTFPNLNIYLIPFVFFPIILRTFFDSRTAIFMHIALILLVGFYAPNNYEFIILQFAAGIVAVFSLNKMHRRVHLVLAALWTFLTYCFIYTTLHLIHEGTLGSYNLTMLIWFAISSVFVLPVYTLIYIFEKLFGFISDVTLIEISDSNQPLLRKLAEQAPGTFQHSLQIANLAEEVILKIGGNPFLVRAGALYHDIGKLAKPNFFIENQAMGMNPHDRLSHIESAKIITEHVTNGVKLAHKNKLPAPIVEFIASHHGTSTAKYFLLKHKEENPDAPVDKKVFQYPGPLPHSKEAAVVMLVDGIEAASRSMKEKTRDNLKGLIDNMIDAKIAEKQLDSSTLTFRDINTIKETLLEKLLNIYHVRIEYPKEKNERLSEVN